MKKALVALCGALVGFGLGALLFRSPEPVPSTCPECPKCEPTRSTGSARHAAQATAVRGESAQASNVKAALPPAAPSAPVADAASEEDREEMARLRARLAQLEEKVKLEEEQRREAIGEPVKRPEGLDARFEQEAVVAAVNSALRDIGLRGEVTAADCSEYPCLVVGETDESFSRERSQALRSSGPFQRYSDDQTLGFGASVGEGDARKNVFGLAVYPRIHDKEQELQIRKRVDYRFWQLQEGGLK